MGLTILVAAVTAAACVGIHHRALLTLSRLASVSETWRRGGVIVGVLGGIVAHVVEIGVYGAAHALLAGTGRHGSLGESVTCGDYVYYSFVTYTTLGFGDITPTGPIRLLTCTEALTGLVLITWTASFLFLQMQRHWQHRSSSAS
jgi:hypothetical protein